uniref:NCK associated protein 5 like n=1 Tax=Pelusios castaneus TaxID=367368 RepID=A0A8C8REI7_9SAUR
MAEAVATQRGDMKPEEGGSEPGTSQELLQRLRELEAENSALAQANENQRETYERCLDEVANHVVQALLNQKDLRQECLKLKKRVFDLERQNQTLSDLFQKKLQLTSGSLPQLALHPVCQSPAGLQLGSLEKLATSLPLGCCALQREVGYEGLRPSGPGAQSLEALSPFFRKKAQILEVLRKLEETDPLLCPLSCQPSPWRDASLSPPEPSSPKPHRASTERRSQAELPGSLEYVNGEGPMAEPPAATPEQWPACLLLTQPELEELLKWKGEEDRGPGGGMEAEGGRPQLLPPLCCQQKSEGSSSSSSEELGELGPLEKGSPGEALLSALAEKQLDLGRLLEDSGCYLQRCLKESTEGCPLNGEPAAACQLEESPAGKALSQDVLSSFSVMGKCQGLRTGPGPAQGGTDKLPFGTDLGLERQAYVSLYLSGGNPPGKSAKGFAQISAQGRPKLQLGPLSPGTGALPLPSPSKMLTLLKIPTPGEKPLGPNPLRLSPQLTRSSKIPCRSNNYEACPSPVLSRRASPEGPMTPACALPPGASGQASPKAGRHLVPGTSPKTHDYENISELSVGGLASPLERPKCSRAIPPRGARPDTPHGPAELCPCAPAREGQDRGPESPPATRRNAVGSAGPRRPGNSPGKKPLEPGHVPFKERLSALGKLKSAEGGEQKEAPYAEKSPEKHGCLGKGKAQGRPCEEALEARAQSRPGAGGSLKHPEHCHSGEPAGKSYSSGSMGAETCSSKHYTAKTRQPGVLCPGGAPHGPRNPPKAPLGPPAKSAKSPHGSPTKLPAKAAAKPGTPRPPEEPKPCPQASGPKRPPPTAPRGRPQTPRLHQGPGPAQPDAAREQLAPRLGPALGHRGEGDEGHRGERAAPAGPGEGAGG